MMVFIMKNSLMANLAANKVNPADCPQRHLFCLRKNAPLRATANSRR